MNTIYSYIRKINYYETDKMGVVHHSNYVRFFEEARVALLDNFGFGYDAIEQMGVMIPVLGVSLDYKNTLTFGDEILIECHISQFNGIKMTVEYKAYRKADMQLTTTGESKHCFVDATTFKPINLKKVQPELYDGLLEIYNKSEHI